MALFSKPEQPSLKHGVHSMFKVHAFLDDKRVLNRRLEHIPRAGDIMRLREGQYGIVTEVVWCMDEDDSEGQRVNIRIESEAATTKACGEKEETNA